MSKGHIKLHRKLLDSEVFSNANTLKVWIWVLLKSNHAQKSIPNLNIKLKPGQFLYGRNSASQELQMAPSSVRNQVSKLLSLGLILMDSFKDKGYSLITVRKWATYQDAIAEDGQKSGHKQVIYTNNTSIVSVQEPVQHLKEFEILWMEYPKKVARKEALKAFKQVFKPALFKPMLHAIKIQKQTKQYQTGFAPNFSTWIRGERYLDVVEEKGTNELPLVCHGI